MTKKTLTATKEDISRLESKYEQLTYDISDLMDKFSQNIINEMHNIVDPVMKELNTNRESNEILTHKVYEDHEPRITTLEVREKKN